MIKREVFKNRKKVYSSFSDSLTTTVSTLVRPTRIIKALIIIKAKTTSNGITNNPTFAFLACASNNNTAANNIVSDKTTIPIPITTFLPVLGFRMISFVSVIFDFDIFLSLHLYYTLLHIYS